MQVILIKDQREHILLPPVRERLGRKREALPQQKWLAGHSPSSLIEKVAPTLSLIYSQPLPSSSTLTAWTGASCA